MTIALRCSSCCRTLTWVSGQARCANVSCGGHDVSAARDVEPGHEGRRRDERLERALLEHAAEVVPVAACGSPFIADVCARLELGGREYGDTWAERPLVDLLGEVREEAADLAGWSVLAVQSIGGLDADQREIVEGCLVDAMRAGARAHGAVLGAMRALAAVPPVGRGGAPCR